MFFFFKWSYFNILFSHLNSLQHIPNRGQIDRKTDARTNNRETQGIEDQAQQRNKIGEQEWRSSESALSHQCVPCSIPGLGVTFGLSMLLVLYSAPRGYLRVLRFSSLLKNQQF